MSSNWPESNERARTALNQAQVQFPFTNNFILLLTNGIAVEGYAFDSLFKATREFDLFQRHRRSRIPRRGEQRDMDPHERPVPTHASKWSHDTDVQRPWLCFLNDAYIV